VLELDATMEAYFHSTARDGTSAWEKNSEEQAHQSVAFKVIEGTSYFEMYKGLTIRLVFISDLTREKVLRSVMQN